jgi:hypothetical protein
MNTLCWVGRDGIFRVMHDFPHLHIRLHVNGINGLDRCIQGAAGIRASTASLDGRKKLNLDCKTAPHSRATNV